MPRRRDAPPQQPARAVVVELESRRHGLAAQADEHAAAPGGLAHKGRAARAAPVSLSLLAQIRVQLVARFACLDDRLPPLGVVEAKEVAAFDRVAEEVTEIADLELRWNVGDEAQRSGQIRHSGPRRDARAWPAPRCDCVRRAPLRAVLALCKLGEKNRTVPIVSCATLD